MTKNKYIKPKITSKTVKLNYFFMSRSLDAMPMDLLSATFSPPGCCFLEGTKVLMENKREVSIDKINPGDIVSSFNLGENKLEGSEVHELIVHKIKKEGYYEVNDNLKITCNHVMWINGTWQEANYMREGDELLGPNGEIIVVKKIKHFKGKEETVYNLSLKGEHNYFANGILVHNKNPIIAQTSYASGSCSSG